MTYRERREAKAERLRGWAGKREDKAEAAEKTAREMADQIPFGQPILMGHHSQRRAQRDQERITGGFSRAHEHATKAEEMRSRADNIEAALDRSIYDDDPDAIERMTERIAALEAQRDRLKAENAAFRTAHRAELKAMDAFKRDQVMPHSSWELSNLSGNIGRNRKRLENLQRRTAGQDVGPRETPDQDSTTAKLGEASR